jgi:hypothetical protein
MSIGADTFEAKGLHPTFDPYEPLAARMSIHQTQCRSCGFEPEDRLTPPTRCPKCSGTAWERFALPGSILNNSARYRG